MSLAQPSNLDAELALGDSKRRKRKQGKPGKRKTRAGISGQVCAAERHMPICIIEAIKSSDLQAPKNFAGYLEEANLESLPEGVPTYLTAAAGPPRGGASRKW